jgi:hypothetical protein
MYWNCRPLKQFPGTGVLLVQFYLYLIFDTHLQYRNQCREWLKIGLSHVVSPGAITTPSLAQAPGISATWRQCTASYFSAISFMKDHYSTHRPNTILKTSITNQEPTYFPKTYKPFQNSRYHEGDKKHKPFWGPINIRHHLTKLVTWVKWNMVFVCPSGWLNVGTHSNIFRECELKIYARAEILHLSKYMQPCIKPPLPTALCSVISKMPAQNIFNFVRTYKATSQCPA